MLWTLLAQLAAPAPELRPLRVERAAVEIDGVLDESVWTEAPATEAFTQKFPYERSAPSERTRVRVLYDERAVYVAVECEQTRAEVIARLTRRDRRIEADQVTVAIDSRGDGATAFEFAVNAAGSLRDTLRYNDTELSDEWDENWEARVARHDRGWTVEMRLPLAVLRFPTKPIQSWGFQVRRTISMAQEIDEWSYIPRNAGGEVSRYGRLVGLEGLRARRPVELRPFVVGFARHRDPAGASLARGLDAGGSAGLDLRWHATTGLTLDATLNPDFAQVDADQVLLNLTRYELLLPEKRPFFLEGRETFATPLPLVYTRRLGRVSPEPPALRTGERVVELPDPARILVASKLVGRVDDRWSIGTLNVLTRSNDVTVEDAASARAPRLVEPWTAFNALRVKREAFGNGHLGATITTTSRAEPTAAYPTDGGARLCPTGMLLATGGRCFHDAYVASLDGRWRSADGTYAATTQLTGSYVHGGPGRTFRDGTFVRPGDADVGGMAKVAKEGGSWVGDVFYEGFGRRLDFNDLGYMRRQNEHHVAVNLEYRTLEPWGRTVETHSRLELFGRRNLDGLNLGDGYQVNTKWRFQNFWEVFVEAHYRTRKFDDREVGDGTALERADLVGLEVEMKSDPRRRVFVEMETQTQKLFDGFFFTGTANVTVRTLPQLDLSIAPQAVFASGEPRYFGRGATPNEYLFGRLDAKNVGATLRATYTFTPTLSLQAYAQLFLASGHYSDFSAITAAGARPVIQRRDLVQVAAPARSPDFREAALNVNVVLRWEYRLGSTLFLVYTRSQDPLVALAPGQMGKLDFSALGRAPAADVVLLKLSYWWSG